MKKSFDVLHLNMIKMFNVSIGSAFNLGVHFVLFPPFLQEEELNKDGYHIGSDKTRLLWKRGRIDFISEIKVGDELEINISDSPNGHTKSEDREIFNRKTRELLIREYREYSLTTGPYFKRRDIFMKKKADVTIVFKPTAITLFRFSAITFNAHQIHYNQSYCQSVEGYPDLVIHGALQITLILDRLQTILAKKSFKYKITSIEYRCISIAFLGNTLMLNYKFNGDGNVLVWITTGINNALVFKGTVTLSKK